MSKLMEEAANTAQEAMEKGYNCCESILMAANSTLELNLSQDTLDSALYFREGMGSGCTCGALVGMVMASSIIRAKFKQPVDQELPKRLHRNFQHEFKSTCCRAIKKSRPIWLRIGNKGCIELTSKSAAMLVEEWEALLGAANQNISHNPNI
jgi:C_GCAxxG_C_C family probable redox protein